MVKKAIYAVVALITLTTVGFVWAARPITWHKNIPSVTTTPTPATDSFKIGIKGSGLYRENGQKFVIKGVTSDHFRFDDGRNVTVNLDTLINDIATVHSWGANTVQMYIVQDLFDDKNPKSTTNFADLKKVIEWGKANGVWVIINPVIEVPWNNGIAQRTQKGLDQRNAMSKFLSIFAQKYGKYPNVLFGLEAEPKFIDSFPEITERIEAVRQFSNQPIIMPVDNFSGSTDILSFLDKNKLENIILDVHVYATRSRATSLGSFFNDGLTKYIHVNPFSKYPVLVGEFGGFWEKDFGTPEDLDYMAKIGEFAAENLSGYSVYSLDKGELSLFDKDGNLTARGATVKGLLENK